MRSNFQLSLDDHVVRADFLEVQPKRHPKEPVRPLRTLEMGCQALLDGLGS